MANHELPEWEAPTTKTSTTPNSFWNRLSQPFTTGNPFLKTPRPTIVHKNTLFTKSPRTQTQAFDKETGVPETAAETATTAEEITQRGNQRRYCGRSRRSCILIIVALVLLLALIIGLLAGLSKKKSSAKDLPLPTNSGIFTGDLTYYSPGPGYGACGFENTSEDSICAVSHIIWDAASTSSNPNNNPLCGKKIRITRYDESANGNRSVDVEVVDRCVGCKATDLDLSLKMFDSLAEESQGRVVGSWAWLD